MTEGSPKISRSQVQGQRFLGAGTCGAPVELLRPPGIMQIGIGRIGELPSELPRFSEGLHFVVFVKRYQDVLRERFRILTRGHILSSQVVIGF